jgi:restriction endonuclease S subunit
MEKRKLNALASINLGANISRFKIDTERFYTYDDLRYDLEHFQRISNSSCRADTDEYEIYQNDVVYSFISEKAAIISEVNSGKIINQNFLKLVVDTAKIDPTYLCFYLNASNDMTRQLWLLTQGTVVRRIPISQFRGLIIPVPTLVRQREIGLAYFKSVKRSALSRRREALENKLLNGILKQMEMG